MITLVDLKTARAFLAQDDVVLEKGSYGHKDEHKVCAVGAVPVEDRANPEPLNQAARELFPKRVAGRWYNEVYNFNDHPATTKADVIAVYDAAIKNLEQGVREA